MKKTEVKVPCEICGNDISKFFGKHAMGICNDCKKVYCPNCVNGLKKDKCPSCEKPVFKTKSIMKELPAGWGPSKSGAQLSQGQTQSQGQIQGQTQGQAQNQTIIINTGIPTTGNSSKKYCPHCGSEISSSGAFCSGCGAKL